MHDSESFSVKIGLIRFKPFSTISNLVVINHLRNMEQHEYRESLGVYSRCGYAHRILDGSMYCHQAYLRRQ